MEPDTGIEPASGNASMRFIAWCGGFIAGIGAQMLFLSLLNNLVGPISSFWSGETLLLILILLAPPVLSFFFLTIEIGSPKESFVRGFQFGALFWFLKVVIAFFW